MISLQASRFKEKMEISLTVLCLIACSSLAGFIRILVCAALLLHVSFRWGSEQRAQRGHTLARLEDTCKCVLPSTHTREFRAQAPHGMSKGISDISMSPAENAKARADSTTCKVINEVIRAWTRHDLCQSVIYGVDMFADSYKYDHNTQLSL